MTAEYTVQDRADIIKKAMSQHSLTPEQRRQVDELVYTLSEANELPRVEIDEVLRICQIVDLVKAGKFTKEMRL